MATEASTTLQQIKKADREDLGTPAFEPPEITEDHFSELFGDPKPDPNAPQLEPQMSPELIEDMTIAEREEDQSRASNLDQIISVFRADKNRENKIDAISKLQGLDRGYVEEFYENLAPVIADETDLTGAKMLERYPYAAHAIEQNPAFAGAVLHEESKLLKYAEAFASAATGAFGVVGDVFAAQFEKPADILNEPEPEQLEDEFTEEKLEQSFLVGAPSNLEGLDVPLEVIARSYKNVQRNRLMTRVAVSDAKLLGADLSDSERADVDLELEILNSQVAKIDADLGVLEPHYDVGPVSEFGLLGLQGAVTSMDPFLAMGAGGAASLMIGAGVGWVSGGRLNPLAVAGNVARFAMPASAATASFNAEFGGLYGQLKDDPDIDTESALGASLLYGMFSSGVEMMQLSVFMNMLGPIGKSIKQGFGAASVKRAMASSPKFREAISSIGKAYAAELSSEGAEEFTQNTGENVAKHIAGIWSGVEGEELTVAGATEGGLHAFVGGVAGGVVLGALPTSVRLGHVVAKNRRQAVANNAVNNIYGAGQDLAARQMPIEAARMIKNAASLGGVPATELYLNPKVLKDALSKDQENMDSNLMDLLGPDAAARLQQAEDMYSEEHGARATLRVSLEEYFENIGHREIASKLLKNMTVLPGILTMSETEQAQVESKERLDELVEEISKEHEEAGGFTPQDETDAEATSIIADGLRETGQYDEEQVGSLDAVAQALMQNFSEQEGIPLEDLKVSIASGSRFDIASMVATKASQGRQIKDVPLASSILTQTVEQLPQEVLRAIMYVDKNTGLQNKRAYLERHHDAAKPMVAHLSFEGTKWKNKENHTAGNLLYRAAAQALAELDPTASKYGGDFVVDVVSEESAAEIAKGMQGKLRQLLQESNPEIADQIEGLEVTYGVAPRGRDVASSVKQASLQNVATKEQREQEGTRAKRGEQPRGVPVADPAAVVLPTEAATEQALPADLAEAELAPEQVFDAAFVNQAAGVLTGEAFFLLPKKAHVAALDLNDLKVINDQYGEEYGDRLIEEFITSARLAGGATVDFAHLSGDEFAIQSDDIETLQLFIDILADLSENIDVKTPKGEITNVTFKYGIDENYDAADKRTEEHKRLGVERERAARRHRAEIRRSSPEPQGGDRLGGGERAQVFGGKETDAANHLGEAWDRIAGRTVATIRRELAKFSDDKDFDPRKLRPAIKKAIAAGHTQLVPLLATLDGLHRVRAAAGLNKKQVDKSTSLRAASAEAAWVDIEAELPADISDFNSNIAEDTWDPISGVLNEQKPESLFEAFKELLRHDNNGKMDLGLEQIAWAVDQLSLLRGLEKIRLPDYAIEVLARKRELDEFQERGEQAQLSARAADTDFVPFQRGKDSVTIEAELKGREWTRITNPSGEAEYWTDDGVYVASDKVYDGVPEGVSPAKTQSSLPNTVESIRRGSAPSSSLVQQIREETNAPISDSGTINAEQTTILLQTGDPDAWMDDFEANPAVRQVYSDADLKKLRVAMHNARAILQKAYDDGIMPDEVPGENPLRGNEDYIYSFDLTTICPKQDVFVATYRAVERKLGRLLSPEERHLMGEMLREAGAQPACWYCYGESARGAYDRVVGVATKIAAEYIKLAKKSGRRLSDKQAAAIFSSKEGGYDWRIDREFRAWLDANWKALAKEPVYGEEVMRDIVRGLQEAPSDRSDTMRSFGKAIHNQAQGATKANAPKGWATLEQHIMNMGRTEKQQRELARINARNGLRFNSQTDFRPWHIIEMSQALASMFAKKILGHVYTKETDFLEVFGGTGMKFNLSAFYESNPDGTLKRDSKGRVVYDDIIGMAGEDMRKWVKKYPRDVGIMVMAHNDTAMLEALESDEVSMIIPYHKGKVDTGVNIIENATDYTSFQAERWKGIEVSDGRYRIGGKAYKKGDLVDVKVLGRKVTVKVGSSLDHSHHQSDEKIYFALVNKLGIDPKFAGDRQSGKPMLLHDKRNDTFVRLAEKDKNGKWRPTHKGYMKMIKDVAVEPTNQSVPDPSKINWKAAHKIEQRWIDEGGDPETADPALVRHVLERIRKNEWPDKAKVKTDEERQAAWRKLEKRKQRQRDQLFKAEKQGLGILAQGGLTQDQEIEIRQVTERDFGAAQRGVPVGSWAVYINDAGLRLLQKDGIKTKEEAEALGAKLQGKGESLQDAAAHAMPDTKVVDESGKPLRVLHGTTQDFTTFDQEQANPESDLGAGFYFSNTPDDIGVNYAGLGPDLQSKLDQTVEQRASERDLDYDDPDVIREVREEFLRHEGATVPVYLNITNPVEIGGPNETWLDMEYKRNGEPKGPLMKFIAALRSVAVGFDEIDMAEVEQTLFDNGSDGLSASDIYTVLDNEESGLVYASDEQGRLVKSEVIRLAFEKMGFDGIIDHTVNKKFGTERRVGKSMEGMTPDTVHYVAFGPTQIKSATGNSGAFDLTDPSILKQDDKTIRGWVNLSQDAIRDGVKIILSEHADVSTPLHELSHVFFDLIKKLVDSNQASEERTADYAKTLEFLGSKDGKLNERQLELFAEAFEQYILEGHAPSDKLVPAFADLRSWMLRIYPKGDRIEIDDNIRGVFDRLLASDAEIQRMREVTKFDLPFFRSAAEAGATEAEFEAYRKKREEDDNKALLSAQSMVAKIQQKALSREWRKAVKDGEAEAAEEFARLPEQRAWKYIKLGKRTNPKTGEVVEELSDRAEGKIDLEAVQKITKADHPVRRKLKGRIVRGGRDPESVAAEYGFESAKEMLDAIGSMPTKGEYVKGRAEPIARQKFPELANENERLAEIAAKAYHQEGAPSSLVQEWMWLRNKAGISGVPPIKALEESAKRMTQSSPHRTLSLGRLLNLERDYAEKAIAAAAAGDFGKAAKMHTQRLLSRFRYIETETAIKTRSEFQRLSKTAQNERARKMFGKSGREFLDAIDGMLEAIGVKKVSTSLEEIGDRLSIGEALDKIEEQGYDVSFNRERVVSIVEGVQGGTRRTRSGVVPRQWRDMTVEELEIVTEALTQLYNVARGQESIVLEGRRIGLNNFVEEVASEAEKNVPKGKLPEPGTEYNSLTRKERKEHNIQNPHSKLQGLHAMLTDPEVMFRRLGDSAHNAIWREGYINSREKENNLAEKVLQKIADLWETLPGEMHERRYDRVETDERMALPAELQAVRAGPRTRQWMMMVALNAGNQSNLDRLLGGYQWKEEDVFAWLDENMEKADWLFVQGIWDLLDQELFPEVAKTFEKVNGIRPPKIEARAIKTRHGTFRGGYFPAKYDSITSVLGRTQEEISTTGNRTPGAAHISKGFTKARAGKYTDVINLDWGVVPQHIFSVIHYSAYEEFVKQADRILNHGRFVETVVTRIGNSYHQHMIDWLKTIASPSHERVASELRVLEDLIGRTRSAFVTSTLGYSMTVLGGDILNPLIPLASGHISAKYLSAATFAIAKDRYRKTREEVLEKSPVLRHRDKNYQQELREFMEDVGIGGVDPKKKIGRQVREAMFWTMTTSDRMTSTAIWAAAYKQSIDRDGMSEKDAVTEADFVVGRILPSFSKGEQPAFLRKRSTFSAMIVFASFFTKMGGLMREKFVDAANRVHIGEDSKTWSYSKAVGSSLGVLMVYGVLSELTSGRGREDDEDYWEWMFRKTLGGAAMTLPLVGPVAEEATNLATHKMFTGEWGRYRTSVRSPLASGIERLARGIRKAADEEKDGEDRIIAVLQAAGLLTDVIFGVPIPIGTSQFGRTAGYVFDEEEGLVSDVESGDLGEVAGGLFFGERDNQPGNIFTAVGEAADFLTE